MKTTLSCNSNFYSLGLRGDVRRWKELLFVIFFSVCLLAYYMLLVFDFMFLQINLQNPNLSDFLEDED